MVVQWVLKKACSRVVVVGGVGVPAVDDGVVFAPLGIFGSDDFAVLYLLCCCARGIMSLTSSSSWSSLFESDKLAVYRRRVGGRRGPLPVERWRRTGEKGRWMTVSLLSAEMLRAERMGCERDREWGGEGEVVCCGMLVLARK